MMRAHALIAGAGPCCSPLTVGTQTSTARRRTRIRRLPAGEGRDVMIRVCSQCHEPEMAAGQQFDAAGWKSLVDQMASKGATATDDEFDQIVRYLANAFPPK